MIFIVFIDGQLEHCNLLKPAGYVMLQQV